jgi:hypothetical protein
VGALDLAGMLRSKAGRLTWENMVAGQMPEARLPVWDKLSVKRIRDGKLADEVLVNVQKCNFAVPMRWS